MGHQNLKFETLLADTDIIPVMVIKKIEDAVPMARDLIAKGCNVLEVTLRTDCALAAVKKIIQEVPEAVVGIGTVTDAEQFSDAYDAGVAFAVSPGATDELIKIADEIPLPLLPGVSTVSEAMKLRACGYRYMKLFPAEAVGGHAFLKSLSGPLPDLGFCPTGGITKDTAPNYLALPNVICVGGSWMIG